MLVFQWPTPAPATARILLLPLLLWQFPIGAATESGPRLGLTSLDLDELRGLAPESASALRRALRKDGAVLLTGVPGLNEAAESMLGELSSCFDDVEAKPAISSTAGEQGPVVSRVGGGVQRVMVATETTNGKAKPLPAWTGARCPGLDPAASKLRTLTGLLLSLFARAADRVAVAAAQGSSETTQSDDTKSEGQQSFLKAATAVRQVTARSDDARKRSTLEEMLQRGTLLEHLSRYEMPAQEQPETGSTASAARDNIAQRRALEMHTDAGLLQALVVRWRRSAQAHHRQERKDEFPLRLEVELPNGQVINAESEMVPSSASGGGVLLLVGQGTEDWFPYFGFRAARHSVSAAHAEPSKAWSRLVYGVMLLPPKDWQLAQDPSGNTIVTFGDWWQRAHGAVLGRSDDEDSSSGCLSTNMLRRRLVDLASTCQAGSIYCWMQCQKVPEQLPCDDTWAVCMSSRTGQICPPGPPHDPSCKPTCPATNDLVFEVLAGEQGASGTYKAEGLNGGKQSYGLVPNNSTASHPFRAKIQWDDNYKMWSLFADGYKDNAVLYYAEVDTKLPPTTGWLTYLGAPPTPQVSYRGGPPGPGPARPDLSDEGFCNGILTDMHMTGFETVHASIPCIIFLFQGWELTSSWKFGLAAVGCIFLGIFLELLVAARRWVLQQSLILRLGRRGSKVWQVLLYAMTRSLGYLVMLITMTYSVELFVSVIVGLMAGYAVFNLDSQADADATPCCAVSSPLRGGSARGGVTITARDSQEAKSPGRVASIQVVGMTCEACVKTVHQAVLGVPHVSSVLELSLISGVLLVELRTAGTGQEMDASADDLRAVCDAIESTGFSAEDGRLLTQSSRSA